MSERPLLRLAPRQERRLKAGHPWAFSNEIAMRPEYRSMEPGTLIRLEGDDGTRFGTFMFNPHSLIAARKLDQDPAAPIDTTWVRGRIAGAAALRARVCDSPFHRLVHAEADGLPGLIIDRYNDVFVFSANTAGMDRLTPLIVEALVEDHGARAVVARNDNAARAQEGLPEGVHVLYGEPGEVSVVEGGVRFAVDPLAGQKTGFFFDQKPNRDRVAALAGGARMLDVFCHVGAFGLRAAYAGAAEVTLVDASQPALDRAMLAAEQNGLASRVFTRRGDAFDVLSALDAAGERFDVVVCDPPAFAKSRKDQEAGLRAYGRVARLAARVTRPGGFLFIASCSHHAPVDLFAERVAEGLHKARREARILATVGAGPDHPVHPMLPESAYLKGQFIQLL